MSSPFSNNKKKRKRLRKRAKRCERIAEEFASRGASDARVAYFWRSAESWAKNANSRKKKKR
jgi:hypothetical protein